jgi:hypothetical protein
MDSYGLILFISWIAAATGLFLFIRWLSRFLSTFKLPNDIRLLILMGFSGVMLVAALSFLWRQGAKDPDTPTETSSARSQKPQTELDLDTYESTTYPELYGLRQEMRKQLNDLQTFFGKITGWADAMPAQRPFLQTIIDIRWEQGKQLQQAYNVIDHSRRAFWLHYHTGEDKHVRTMFNDEAVRLQKRIQDALGDSREFQLAEADAIRVYLQKVDAILKEAKLPKPKAGQALSSVFMPYSDQNRQTLINVLTTKQEASVLANLNQLQQEEKHIRDKLAYMLQYQQVNTDLLTETNDLILAWNDALIYNQYAQYRLLFATEALETTQLLGVTPANRDYAWLLKELRELAPTILTQAQVERDIAAYSYNPDIVNAKQRKRLKPR